MEAYSAVTGITKIEASSSRPVPASILASAEAIFHDRLASLQPIKHGCTELDDVVLLGGLRRGSVIGISTDDTDYLGLLMGLQGMIKAILDGSVKRALVITPRPPASISKFITIIGRSILSNFGLGEAESQNRCRTLLDSVMISVVFDIDGICQTLSELLQPGNTSNSATKHDSCGINDSLLEIPDSEDEELSQSISPHPDNPPMKEGPGTHHDACDDSGAILYPEIIVVTHFSTLLTSLFARREKTAAHQSLALLRARLRKLSISSDTNPLVLLLNSTTEEANFKLRDFNMEASSRLANNKGAETALRSIFASVRSLRTSRPSFGIIFNQLLDMHLLCTDVSNHQRISYCGHERNIVSHSDGLRHSPTLVEVLQDNLAPGGLHGHKYHQEQRWAVLCVANHQIVNVCEQCGVRRSATQPRLPT